MGGGRGQFLPNTYADPDHPEKMGRRTDGRNLIEEWIDMKELRGETTSYVWNKNMMKNIKERNTDNILGNS